MIHHVQQHAKFKKLVRRLRPLLGNLPIDIETVAIGLLERLWHATITNAYRGDIGKLDDETIANELGWHDEPEQIISLLVDCGWLDRDNDYRLVVHDWAEHAPKHVKGNATKHGGFVRGSPREPSPKEAPKGRPPKGPPPDKTKPNLTVGSTSTSTTTSCTEGVEGPRPDPERAARIARKVGGKPSPENDALAWKLSAAVNVLGENWLEDAIEAVRRTKPSNRWGYLWTCLEEGATKAGRNLRAELRGIPPPPKGWRIGLDENLQKLPDFSRRTQTDPDLACA